MQSNCKTTRPSWLTSCLRQVVAIVVALSFSVTAGAQEVVCDPEAPHNCSAYLHKGDTAPFDGYILTPARAAELSVSADGCDDWLDRERRYLTDTATVQIKYLTRICAIEQNVLRAEADAMRRRAEELAKQNSSFWRQQEVWFGIGAVSGVLSVLLGAWAVSLVAK